MTSYPEAMGCARELLRGSPVGTLFDPDLEIAEIAQQPFATAAEPRTAIDQSPDFPAVYSSAVRSVPLSAQDCAANQPHAHVLIVEEDSVSGRVLEASLEAAGHRVTRTTSSNEARRIAVTNPPDLILSDVQLGGMDGIELTHWFRTQEATATVPIVLVAAMDDSRMLARGVDAGADDFLSKPVNSLELRTRLNLLLRNKIVADELSAREQAAAPFGLATTAAQTDSDHQAVESEGAATSGIAAHQDARDSAKPHVITILVIEDQELERTLLKAFLDELPCTVETSYDGRSALTWLEKHSPDLVVLDLLLPDIDGYELIRQMKSDARLTQIPILVVSGNSQVEDRVKALQMGADDFLVKGFDRLEFQARARRLIRSKRCLDQLSVRCDQAIRQAITDSLTGLFTHGFLQEMLQREMTCARRHSQQLSLIFADIDHFKQINDNLGHAAGDHVLKAVAQSLRDSLRASDTLARYGGDEFVASLPYTDRAAAGKLAERLRAVVESLAINRPGTEEQDRLRVTISIGVASFPEDGTEAESLLHHADEALYAAKQAGRNSVVSFNPNGVDEEGQPQLLIVDDEEDDLFLMGTLLAEEGYQILKARDGKEAIEIARRAQPDVILLDVMLPQVDGFEVCRRLKQESGTWLAAVILVTGLSSRENKLRGIEVGADEFIVKPVGINELLARVRSLLRKKRTRDVMENAETVVFTLARAVESRDPSTGGHVERVSHYAAELGKALGLPEAQVKALRRAGVVHDIGKVVVPDAILLKPGKLSPGERKIMERHVDVGYELLRPLRTFAESLPAVRFHHERLDGSGYPLGLRGDQVPVVAQIMGIVDVYDALTCDRAYRAALSQVEAIQILREETGRGLHNPRLVETFVRLVTGDD